MARTRSDEEFHARHCAVRDVRSALVFVFFCALEVYLSWRALGKTVPRYGLLGILRDVAVIAACFKLLAMYRCFRERFVVGLIMLRFVIGLIFGFISIFFSQAVS